MHFYTKDEVIKKTGKVSEDEINEILGKDFS